MKDKEKKIINETTQVWSVSQLRWHINLTFYGSRGTAVTLEEKQPTLLSPYLQNQRTWHKVFQAKMGAVTIKALGFVKSFWFSTWS